MCKENEKKWELKVSNSTRLRQLHKLGFRSCVPKIKPFLLSKQIAARIKWCKQRLFWDQNDWKKVFFGDESMFCVSHENKGIRVWRIKQEVIIKIV